MADKGGTKGSASVETTGHSWDGIEELNNPLPRWWLWTLYATIVFAIGYVIAYPALPGLTGATHGWLGWSSRGDIQAELSKFEAGRSAQFEQLNAMPVEQIMADPALRTLATSAGASLFKVNCVQCHGSGAQGRPGYPNLNDDSWIHGGTPGQIFQTIRHGVRAADDPDTRMPADMPRFGADNMLTPDQVGQATQFVLQLSGQAHDAVLAQQGSRLFADNCAACHGDKGQGNQELGAPQLNDAIWLYGGSEKDIAAQIRSPRHGMMPGWQARLGEAAVKQLAVYVHSLGGGQ